MVEVFLLAIALSMDAFAVSIGLGSKKTYNVLVISLKAGLYFGLFQGLMPLIGYYGGRSVFGWIENYANWIAFILLLVIGLKMVYESFGNQKEEDSSEVTHRMLIVLAIATSIDAMAAGFTLNLLEVSAFTACFIIGITTLIFSLIGVVIGNKSGTWLESKAELFGGVMLVTIGIKILII